MKVNISKEEYRKRKKKKASEKRITQAANKATKTTVTAMRDAENPGENARTAQSTPSM